MTMTLPDILQNERLRMELNSKQKELELKEKESSELKAKCKFCSLCNMDSMNVQTD